MLTSPLLDDSAPWKERFRVPVVLGTQIAAANPARGIAGVVAHSNAYHLYCLDIGLEDAVGELRLLYRSPKLTVSPALSSNGEVVVIANTERTGKLQYTLLAFDARSGERIGELGNGAIAALPVSASGSAALYV